MPEQCRHNRGSFTSCFFFLIKEELRDSGSVPLCGTNVYMYMHTESLWREFEL